MEMKSNRKYLSAIAFLAGLFVVVAQPTHGQVEAIDQLANPLPESGRWFTNDGSRTGFFIEVQAGIVAGLYVGGDANGKNVWLSFNGVLQPGATTDGEGVWILDTDLLRISASGCIIDCSDAVAGQSSFEDVGDIRIDFRGRSEGMVWVDDQPVREIAPLYFGVGLSQINPVAPPVFLPELEGKWVVARASGTGFPEEYLDAAVIEIGERTVESLPVFAASPPDAPKFRYRNTIIDDPDEMFPADAVIECTTFVDATIEPTCFISYEVGPMASFAIDFDWISDTRVTVLQSFDDFSIVQFQLFRLNHD